MKSKRKVQKILNIRHLLQVIKEKDDKIIMMGSTIDSHYFAMQGLAKFMKMDDIEKLSMLNVIDECKRKLGE